MTDPKRSDPTLPLLLYGDSYRFPDVYHLTRFLAPDAFITLEHGDERVMVVNSLEFGRAQKESRATSVRNVDEFGQRELTAAGTPYDDAAAIVISRVLRERKIEKVAVPRYFPLAVADRLRAEGIALEVARQLDARRRTKRDDEIVALTATQRATEEAWALGVAAISRATVGKDRVLQLDGKTFTAEMLRAIVDGALLDRGCSADGTICAPGTQAADPHMGGSGPLHAGEAIVMDIFPQHKTSRYFADMTRTISKGAPSDAIVKMYEVVKRAQDAGIAALRPGITGKEVHELVEDVIYDAGYETLRPEHKRRTDDPITRGMIHGTGHGVGLEIHEAPSVGRAGRDPLAAGDVVTVEPGIYDPDVGGVRLEDMLVITESGYRNLTRAPRELVV
ncbi:MAG: M24 family metallopeptidase [Chloroflexi bacterium]|nr:M24 family metallopeptidase [Chloroflexota bacterium]